MPLTAVTPDVPVADFRQVRAGAYWHWNSLARAATNKRLFNGDFSQPCRRPFQVGPQRVVPDNRQRRLQSDQLV